ncbi:MAG: FAD-dependent oxidoreductase [Cytophagales bacterium]|nr:FAD-dependent oxidoreductase [Cytophagales bacterium]MDW8383279.1 FAD-dependent oxidoreductase [Flammeovirgaceae bacterium]
MITENTKIAVIGAGPAGLTAAYQLTKHTPNVDLYELSPYVGGMCRTFELWGSKVDVGPHRFFSYDQRVNKIWLEVAQNDYDMVKRLTRIYYNNRFFAYPLKPFNAFANLGPFETVNCIFSYLKEKVSPTPLKNDFETWVIRRFGKRLYEIFFKTYSEKLWGIPCHELDSDFAAQRIKKLSLSEAIKNAFAKSGNHKTLVDEFAYPLHGTGMIYERMAQAIRTRGGKIFLKTPVQKILTQNRQVKGLQLVDGTQKEYDYIISSMPLTQLTQRLDEAPDDIKAKASQLTYRNTIIVYLNIESNCLFPDNWLYIHSEKLKTGRITNFNNWLPSLIGNPERTILALEYWCYEIDEIWKSPDEVLINIAQEDIRNTGLIKGANILDGYVLRIPKCYPVYKAGYKEILKPIEKYLATIQNLYPIGRYGAFKYNNQDHSILMGLLAAENIIHDACHNLWEINTDYDTYQESVIITKTGLQKKS